VTDAETRSGLLVAWDTCTSHAVIAAAVDGRSGVERIFRTEKGHTGSLLPLLEEILGEIGAAPRDIGAVACGVGPGGYTGVKVGVTTAKALSLALGVPLVGLSTLELLAASASAGTEAVLTLMDAKQGLWYAAVYGHAADGLSMLEPPSCATADAVSAIAGRHAGRGLVAVVGEAGGSLPAFPSEVDVVEEVRLKGAALLAVANRELWSGRASDAFAVQPVYLKKAV